MEKVAAVPEDRWSDQSPCEDWKARDVVRHVVGQGMAPALVGVALTALIPALAAANECRFTAQHDFDVDAAGLKTLAFSLGSSDASNVVPTELRADIVTVVTDKATRDPLMIVIVEPQGRSDRTKRFSWPAYLANLRDAGAI